MQDEFDVVLNGLKKYSPKKSEYIKDKISLLYNAEKIYDWRKMIIDEFKNKIFPFYHKESKFEDEDEDDIREKMILLIIKRLIFFKGKRHKWWISHETHFSSRSDSITGKIE